MVMFQLSQRPASKRLRPRNHHRLSLEELESRTVLATLTPAQIRHAYGFDQITFANGTIVGDGRGQTIAIVDAYDHPRIASDLAAFDALFGLPAPPSFTKVQQ